MAAPTSPNFISHADERREIIRNLPSSMDYYPQLRAVFWYADIEGVRFLAAECAKDAVVQATAWSLLCSRLMECWMQRGSTFRSSSPSPSSSPSRPSSPSPFIHAATSSAIEVTPRKARSKSAMGDAKTRDGERCIVTRQTRVHAAHVYPYCLTNLPAQNVRQFWGILRALFPTREWFRAVAPQGIYKDTSRNLMCLAPDPHEYHTNASFGLRPIDKSDDGTSLRVEFNWLELSASSHHDRRYLAEPILQHAHHRRHPNPVGPGTDLLVNHETLDFIGSGHIIVMTTDDPEGRPLPDFDTLDMQWHIQLLIAASGHGLPEVAHSITGREMTMRANYDGAGDWAGPSERKSRLDVHELSSRLRNMSTED